MANRESGWEVLRTEIERMCAIRAVSNRVRSHRSRHWRGSPGRCPRIEQMNQQIAAAARESLQLRVSTADLQQVGGELKAAVGHFRTPAGK